jgi:EpsI family protein
MAAGAVLSAWLVLRPELRVSPEQLATLPQRIGSFEGHDAPLDAAVEAMLQADHHVQRVYVHPLGGFVSLYVGYYGTARGGTPEHTPFTCYRAQGWSILEQATLQHRAEADGRLREYVVENAGRRHLVMYWYRSFRRTGMISTLELRLDHLVGQLEAGRGDGALVRISTPLVGLDHATARSMLLSFAQALEPELGVRWPAEVGSASAQGNADTLPLLGITHSRVP